MVYREDRQLAAELAEGIIAVAEERDDANEVVSEIARTRELPNWLWDKLLDEGHIQGDTEQWLDDGLEGEVPDEVIDIFEESHLWIRTGVSDALTEDAATPWLGRASYGTNDVDDALDAISSNR